MKNKEFTFDPCLWDSILCCVDIPKGARVRIVDGGCGKFRKGSKDVFVEEILTGKVRMVRKDSLEPVK